MVIRRGIILTAKYNKIGFFLVLWLACSTLIAAKVKFAIVAQNSLPTPIMANSIVSIQYLVTNQTTKTRQLTMRPIPGVTVFNPGQVDACTLPFTLAPGQSCRLNLRLHASQMGPGVSQGPVICKTRGNDSQPDPFLCSQPSYQDSLHVAIQSCTSGRCLPNSLTLALRRLTSQYRQQFGIPAVVAGIWLPGRGELIIEDGFADLSNLRPVSRLDHLRIGSVTKSFTVTVILQLISEGRLSLLTLLSQFMPGLQNSNATIADLANMRSGIFNYTEDTAFAAELLQDLTRSWLPAQLINIANRNLPYFPAGTNWHYSNTNTLILGLIIQQLSQHSIGQEIERRLLKPLGLKNTLYPLTMAIPTPFARGYGFSPLEDLTNANPSIAAASGAMISRLEDLKTWAIALGQGRSLTPTMQAQRLASLQPIVFQPCADTVPGRPLVTCPEYDRYGFGIGELSGWIGHTGEFFGYSSLVMYHPPSKGVIVIWMNIFGVGPHLPTKLFLDYLQLLA
ncbi:D-alanyl-D-alanine carboxypeptidase precursor [Legionella clemsonensis]|uniref:D-alanyl-D-alanine carboxypeptidase n=2 Tax=Legionella clemsonensis TaxID=1867846 RepID=A0A222P011_9GAMM|nr:D-alanyl-D-alanine carboxypeptidase precursor [Legionella clemsonensis]